MKPSNDIRICFIGDSFVAGTGDDECLGWVGRVIGDAVNKGYNVAHYNLGVRGDTAPLIRDRWLEETQRRLNGPYDSRAVFSFGVNDAVVENGSRRCAMEESLSSARAILTASKETYETLWIGPPPVADRELNRYISELSLGFSGIAAELGAPYLHVVDTLLTSQIWIEEASSNDGGHPGAKGYAELAEIITNWDKWWFKHSSKTDKLP